MKVHGNFICSKRACVRLRLKTHLIAFSFRQGALGLLFCEKDYGSPTEFSVPISKYDSEDSSGEARRVTHSHKINYASKGSLVPNDLNHSPSKHLSLFSHLPPVPFFLMLTYLFWIFCPLNPEVSGSKIKIKLYTYNGETTPRLPAENSHYYSLSLSCEGTSLPVHLSPVLPCST